ncbi:alpha/beta fold hydrolase [Agromyces sp. MMS24-K17]|uniref:alpha/beta fold hydrolase n=1 Tax=Agromyces sp. MMS24-K17 TaxID=3372850 RepID=UPI003754D816
MAHTRWFRRGDRVVRIVESGRPDAPPIVLVHGLGMAHEYWQDLVDALGSNARVLALDLPGFGDSPDPAEPLSMPEAGALLGELLDEEQLVAPTLVGHSTGAQVVTETAAQRPALVGRVVLIGPTVDPRERTVPMQASRFLQDLSLTNPKVLAVGLHSYVEGGIAWYVRNLRPMIEHRIELALPAVESPTLVIRAEHDRIVPRDWGLEVARLVPGVRYVEVPGRGHETMVTGAPIVADLIARHARGEDVGDVPEVAVERAPARRPFPTARKAGVWIADYVYAGLAHVAVPLAGRTPREWLRGDPALPDVVLLPGVYEHWSFLRKLGERMHRAGYRVRTVHGLGVNRAPIPETGEKLLRALARMPRPAAGRIIVGHSKGGLIGKYVLVHETEAAADLGVLGVVAVATPFAGSRRAELLRYVPSVGELLPDAPTILTLGEASTVNGRIVSVFGPYDPHVPDGSEVEGATNVVVPVSGHFRILGARQTADAVVEGLELITALPPVRGDEPVVGDLAIDEESGAPAAEDSVVE